MTDEAGIAIGRGSALIDRNHELFVARERIDRLEGVMDWVVRVASEPGPDTHMALRRIAEEARKALTSKPTVR